MNSSFDKANKRENVSEGPLTRRQSLSSSHTSKKSKPLGNAIIDKELYLKNALSSQLSVVHAGMQNRN